MVEERKALYEFHVAGVQHHKLHTCIEEIKVGDILTLTSEPTNRFDPNAVRVEFESINQDSGIMLGYVPAAKGDYSTKVSAAMMTRRLRCEVLELNPEAKTWEQLKVGIFDEDEVPGGN
uniref:Putative HIRAN domain containing protein n=1 Tax=viral metagenome TaxID=1070528 RepID=A0A6H1ZT27_9ZZZZ